MTWQVIQYLDENPGTSLKDVIGYFAEQLEVDTQLQYLSSEVDRVLEIRDQLRPLYGEKMNLEQQIMLIDSDLDMEVMIKYPPRKGSDSERKAYKAELQGQHDDHPELSSKLEKAKDDIKELELLMSDVQQRGKNARRMLETFNHISAFILAYYGATQTVANAEGVVRQPAANANLF